LKDKNLHVRYFRGDNGELFVYLYRAKLHIATFHVDAINGFSIFSGVENYSKMAIRKCDLSKLEVIS
jgi:hypothetical protein